MDIFYFGGSGGGGGSGDALVSNPLSQFAATTSAQIAGVLSDETGTGAAVFANSPTLVTPALGTPTALVLTNATGLVTAGINANQVTNAKLAQVATQTIKGRTTAGTGDPEDLTATQATALLNQFVGDTGSGGTKGLVPAPTAGDASKALFGDGTYKAIAGGGDALVANPLSQFAATTSLQLKGVISDETGSGALVFATSPTLITPALGTPASGVVTNLTYTPPGTGAVSRTVVSRFNETVSVKDFGAVGNGTTDDTAAIQAALNYANTGIRVNVYFPPGFYRTTATLSAPASYSILSGAGVEVSVIRCDLSVTPAIRIGNASGGAATFHSGIRDIKVTRDAGTVPNDSVGIDFNTFNYMLDFNVLCDRHAFGRVVTSSSAGISIQYDCIRPLSTNMKTADFGIYNVAGVRVFGGEIGMNGGETYDRTAHVIFSGDANDVSFSGVGFLPRGPSISKPALAAFNSYINATSLIRFVDCVSENIAVVVQSDAATPVVVELVFQGGRYSYDSSFWNYNAATKQKYSKLIGVQMSSIVSNSNVIVAPEVFTITGCQIFGNVNLVGGTNASVNMTGNTLVGSTTLSLNGAWTSLNVIGNNLISGTITDNATGTKVIANNSPASAWVTYTPTISAVAGSFTAASGTGRYKISGKSVDVNVQMTITTVGTGTYPRFTLPFACSSNGNRYPLNGKNASTGIVWSATVDPGATIVQMSRGHDNSGTVASGDVLCAGGTYEIA